MPPQTINISSFIGGINRRVLPSEINDNELVESVNFELEGTSLKVRNGTAHVTTGTIFPTDRRITSIALLDDHVNGRAIIFTSGTKVFRDNGAIATDITGGLIFPDDTVWDWVQFDDVNLGAILIGVNRGGVGQTATVKIATSASNCVALGGTPPPGRFIEAIHNRVFIVPQDDRNVVKFCKLGNAEDWTNVDPIIGSGIIKASEDVPGAIRGIKAYQESLYIFYRTKIFRIFFGSLPTDASQWSVRLVANNVGSTDDKSIQEVAGDLVFRGDDGIISMLAVEESQEETKSIREVLLSNNVPDIKNFSVKGISASVVIPGRSQYWVSTDSDGDDINDTIRVLDYSLVKSGQSGVAWFDFRGQRIVGSAYAIVPDDNNNMQIYIGSEKKAIQVTGTDTAGIFKYGLNDTTYNDAAQGYNSFIRTKAYDFGVPYVRKKFHRVLLSVESLTLTPELVLTYFLNENDDLSRDYRIQFSSAGSFTSFYDSAIFGTNRFSTDLGISDFADLRLHSLNGNRGRSIQFRIRTASVDMGYIVKQLALVLSPLSHRLTKTSAIVLPP